MKKLNEIVWRHVKYKMCTNQLLICLFVVFLCHWNKFKVYARKKKIIIIIIIIFVFSLHLLLVRVNSCSNDFFSTIRVNYVHVNFVRVKGCTA